MEAWMSDMRISVMTPIYDEIFWLPLWLKAVDAWADEIVVVDTGSTDGSWEYLAECQKEQPKLKVDKWPDRLEARYRWPEGKIRNHALVLCSGEWVVALDVDEFMGDGFIKEKDEIMETDANTVCFPMCCFWGDCKTRRINTPEDPRWSTILRRMWRKEILSWKDTGNHASPSHTNPILVAKTNWFHYHYALGPKVKLNDNRWGELGLPKPDAVDVELHFDAKTVLTEPFVGEHPTVIREYLNATK